MVLLPAGKKEGSSVPLQSRLKEFPESPEYVELDKSIVPPVLSFNGSKLEAPTVAEIG